MDPLIGFGGFFLAQLTFVVIARWVGVIYVEIVNQPPEVRRPQTIVPVMLLHSERRRARSLVGVGEW